MNEYRNKTDMINAVTYAYEQGTTNSDVALRHLREVMFARNNGERDEFPNVGVFVSDGHSMDRESTFFVSSY